MNKAASTAQFASTHWSVVLTATDSSAPGAREALEKLCRTYWYPLYAFIRRDGHDPQDAQDLTQSYFAWLLESDQLSQADPHRGKFRSFLLSRLKHFLSDARKRARAQKRGGGLAPISLDSEQGEARYHLEPATDLSADKIFERRWALMLLERAVSRLRAEYVTQGRERLFEGLKGFQPGEGAEQSYADVACELGMTESAVKSAIWRMRRRHRDLLREEIAQTVASPAELEEEIRHLIEVVGG